MKPEIKEQIDGYTFHWEDQKVSIVVNRIVVHRDGRVTGEILIRTENPEYSPILMPSTQLNFSAERTRTSLAKNLKDKYPDFNWDGILDELAYYIQDMARQGEPVQELWTSDNIKAPEYLLEPFIYKGLPNIIFGEKGVNKSTLALVFYACLVLPWHDNPLSLNVPNRSVQSLILDWETEGDIVQYYAKRLQEGMDLPPFPVNYRRCALPLLNDIEQIQQHIQKTGSEIIIIDSLGAAAGGDLKTPEIALNFFTGLRRLKTSSLIIAQTSKDEETKRKRVFGSVYFEYYARNIWEISKSESISDDEYDIALFQRHSNLSSQQKPVGFRLQYNGMGMRIDRVSVDIRDFISKVTTKAKVENYLKEADGMKTTQEIVDGVGVLRNTVDVTLNRMLKNKQVVKCNNKWGLAYD